MSTPVRRFLDGGDTLARLHDHARGLLRVQEVLKSLLPPALAAGCDVANLKDNVLVVSTRGGAAAARLRQMVPSLISSFAERGLLLHNIQVKVGVSYAPPPPPPRTPRSVGQGGRESLAALIEQLPEDAPLRASLQRLLERSRPE